MINLVCNFDLHIINVTTKLEEMFSQNLVNILQCYNYVTPIQIHLRSGTTFKLLHNLIISTMFFLIRYSYR